MITSSQFTDAKAIMPPPFKANGNANLNNAKNRKNRPQQQQKMKRPPYQNSVKKSQWRQYLKYQSAYFGKNEKKLMNNSETKRFYDEKKYEYPPMKMSEKYEGANNDETNDVNSKKSQNAYMKSTHCNLMKMPKMKIIKKMITPLKTFACKRCDQEFYFNNKLHKHLKDCKKPRKKKPQNFETTTYSISNIPIFESNSRRKKFHEFAFRKHHYVIVKTSLQF